MSAETLIPLVFLCLVASIALGAVSFAPWVPSRRRDVARVTSLAALRPGDVLYDLGCGDGRIVVAAARLGVRAVGIELAVPLWAIAKLRVLAGGKGNATVRFGDLFAARLDDATVVYCFGVPRTLAQKLRAKLLAELAPGTRIISYAFPIEGLSPTRINRRDGELPLFLYTVGA
jgi:hypothetical protein